MPSLPWYHATTIYQIYPRSYYDSNGDGIGDLQGIIKKLDHIRGLGFETIWCSPFYDSPQKDFGYDISNYTGIAPEYGSMNDALQLIEQVHRRGMKIVLDMVMNHTSMEHPWFEESRSSRSNPKADWYLWLDKPNNWQSMTGGTGWHYAPERGQYYWSSFLPFQPDLNYRNPDVQEAMFGILRFWLGKGVDGFRLDIFNSIFKDTQYRNNPFSFRLLPDDTVSSRFFQEAKYTINQPEGFRFARELRNVCAEYGEIMLLGEVSGPRNVIRKFMGSERNDGLGLVFDFGMLTFDLSSKYFRDLIGDIEGQFPDPFMPVYVFSNHDNRRSMKRLGGDVRKAKLLHLLQFTARGVPCLYYGEELGMTDGRIPFARALDPIPHRYGFIPKFIFDLLGITINRDEVRTPMQWNGSRNAGFSTAGETWLPVNKDYRNVNVEGELRNPNSLMSTIRELLKVRQEFPALHSGALEFVDSSGIPEQVLNFKRRSGNSEVLVVMNFDERSCQFEFKEGNWKRVMGLHAEDDLTEGIIRLDGFGGMILNSVA